MIIEVIVGLGGFFGFLFLGYFIREFGFFLLIFIFIMCIFAAFLLLGIFLLEFLFFECKVRFNRLNFCSKFKGVWEFYISNKNGKGIRWRYVCFLLIFLCV